MNLFKAVSAENLKLFIAFVLWSTMNVVWNGLSCYDHNRDAQVAYIMELQYYSNYEQKKANLTIGTTASMLGTVSPKIVI